MAKHRIIIALEYDDAILTPGGIGRNEPSNEKELVEEIERNTNASLDFGGSISLIILSPKESSIVESCVICRVNPVCLAGTYCNKCFPENY